MSVENVQKFFELVKSNEDLAQEIEKIKNEAQNKAGTVDYEKIISENVIPMAKERGLEFTLEDFLTYSSSIAPQGELSDDDLLNVSGGWSGSQMLATGLMLLTLGSSGLSMMGNIQSPGGGDGSSAGSAPTSSYSMSINNVDEAAEETAEDTILQKVENSNIEKSSEDVSNEADEVIENNSEESDVADEDNGSTEDVSFNEEDAATTAQEDATEATEEETEIETNKEIDNAEGKEEVNDEETRNENEEENDGIEMTEEEIDLGVEEENKSKVEDNESDFSYEGMQESRYSYDGDYGASSAENDEVNVVSQAEENAEDNEEAKNEVDAEDEKKDEASAKVKYESYKKNKKKNLTTTLVDFIRDNNIKSLDDIEEGSREAFKNDVLKIKDNLKKLNNGDYTLNGKLTVVEKAGDNGPYSVMYNIINPS